MKAGMKTWIATAVMLSLAACSRNVSPPPTTPAAPPASAAAASKSATAGAGALSSVQLGMNYQQVMTLLGPPTNQNSYMTGKAFIPFYFGNDVRRTSYYYKGKGRVVFAAGNAFGGGSNGEVVSVEVDPGEPGYPRE